MMKTNPFFLSLLTLALIGAPVAYAETQATTGLNVTLDGKAASAHAQIQANLSAKAQDRGTQEINRRIEALNKLSARIAEMKRVSDTEKSDLKISLDNQISLLTTLKTKIDADTDETALKTDLQSITKSYRTFMVVLPQGAIMATADRINATGDLMTSFGTKLQTRITAAATAGQPVTTLQSTYKDYTSKIADAKAQATAAIALTANLKPDNGDQATIDSNKKALTDAHTKITAGLADLKAARADAATITKTLKGFNASTNAHVNADTSTQ